MNSQRYFYDDRKRYRYSYDEVKIDNCLFIERKKQWNPDTLVTKQDFEDFKKTKSKIQEEFCNTFYFGPNSMGETYIYTSHPNEAGRRFMVCFYSKLNENLINLLKGRGFRIKQSHIGRPILLIAEENVDIEDAHEFALSLKPRCEYVDNDRPYG